MVRDESKEPHADAGLYRELTEILVGIKRATKTFLAYPAHHPARVQALDRPHKQILRLLTQQGSLTIDVRHDGFFCAKVPVGQKHPLLEGFSTELTLRGIQAIRFLPEIRLEDLQHLTELLTTEAGDLSRRGGSKAFLQEHGTLAIELEDFEMKFVEATAPRRESVTQPESPVPEPIQQTPPPAAGESPPVQEAPKPEEEPRREAGEPTETPREAEAPGGESEEEPRPDLETLLRELQKTDRSAQYEHLTEELLAYGREVFARGEGEPCLRILAALARELHPSNPKGETVTRYARWTLRSLLDETGPQIVIEGLCRGGPVPDEDLVHLLLTMKEEVAGPVVDQFLIEKDVAARQKLADFLIQMGPDSVPAMRSALKAPSWEAARRLFPLLPRLPAPEAAEILKRLVRHYDPRIRRESVKLLGHMGAELTAEALLGVLRDTERSVRQAAMTALGGLKVKSAIGPLRQIAEAPPGTRDPEEQKTAIAALGAIGDTEALPTLIALLHKKRWLFRRRTEELRIAAVYALGVLGGSDAMDALRAVVHSAPPKLKQACDAALRGTHPSEDTEGA